MKLKPFLFCALLASPLQAAIILVDVGYSATSGAASQTTDTGWNNLYWNATVPVEPTDPPVGPMPVSNLVYSTGTASGFNLAVTTNGLAGPAGNANALSGVPSTASIDSFYGAGTPTTLTLSNLDPTLVYSFKFYSAVNRTDSINRMSRFTINGQSVQIQSYNNEGNWTDTISNISPDASGNIAITVARGTGNTSSSYLLNIIHIETAPIPEPSTALIGGLALIPLLRRRR